MSVGQKALCSLSTLVCLELTVEAQALTQGMHGLCDVLKEIKIVLCSVEKVGKLGSAIDDTHSTFKAQTILAPEFCDALPRGRVKHQHSCPEKL